MRIMRDLFEALKALEREDSLTAVVEAKEDSLLRLDIAGSLLSDELKDLEKACGTGLRFRAFNENVEVNWRGDYGTIAEGRIEREQTTELFIESDIKRHPGMIQFADKIGDLHNCRVRAAVLENGGYLRLLEIVRGE